tara:strand:- start:112 stop:369 length:258 start_codon:yes stop_codon:yes gene_type:complete
MPSDDRVATYDELFNMVRETRADLRQLKDNHLHHIEKDISELKVDVVVIKTKLEPIEAFVNNWQQQLLVLFVGAVAVALGVPMMM